GQALAACPTVQTRRVAPGHHLVVATREGYLTRTVDVVVIGGKREARTLTLVPMSTTARITHPWQTWKPWAVFAAGAGVAAFGGLLQIGATTEMARYARAVTRACSLFPCNDADLAPLNELRSSARLQSGIALGMVGVGSAAVITGSILLYLN